MARIAGVNIPDNKHVRVSLTYVYGIGNSLAAANEFPIPYTYVSETLTCLLSGIFTPAILAMIILASVYVLGLYI